jgi:hypothetical protein
MTPMKLRATRLIDDLDESREHHQESSMYGSPGGTPAVP